jgi:hypothetical protein
VEDIGEKNVIIERRQDDAQEKEGGLDSQNECRDIKKIKKN